MSRMCTVTCLKTFQPNSWTTFEEGKVYKAYDHWWDPETGELALGVWPENDDHYIEFREGRWEDKFRINEYKLWYQE